MIFRFITCLCVLILLYAGFEYGRLAWLARDAHSPGADFLVLTQGKGPNITAFIDYSCTNCAPVYKALADIQELHPNLTLTIRPIAYIDTQAVQLAHLAMAAGSEGHFPEIHAAFIEQNGQLSDSFLRETFSLYGMDYTALSSDETARKMNALLEDNSADARWFGVETVPSLIVNDILYTVPAPIEDFSVSNLLPLLAPPP